MLTPLRHFVLTSRIQRVRNAFLTASTLALGHLTSNWFRQCRELFISGQRDFTPACRVSVVWIFCASFITMSGVYLFNKHQVYTRKYTDLGCFSVLNIAPSSAHRLNTNIFANLRRLIQETSLDCFYWCWIENNISALLQAGKNCAICFVYASLADWLSVVDS